MASVAQDGLNHKPYDTEQLLAGGSKPELPRSGLPDARGSFKDIWRGVRHKQQPSSATADRDAATHGTCEDSQAEVV